MNQLMIAHTFGKSMEFLAFSLRYTFVLSTILFAHQIYCSPGSLSTCIAGCKCSTINEAAVCCLLNRQNGSKPEPQAAQFELFPSDSEFCALPLQSGLPRWPDTFLCLPSWRQLKIHLFDRSWSFLQTLHPNNLTTHTCNPNLERLSLIGSPGFQDDLYKLDPVVFRTLFFPLPDLVKLRRFTVEQTSLTEISPGFFDQIRTNQLTDLEIRRNPTLTNDNLGVGWLANLPELKLLDLSQNRLYAINLARWGFSVTKASVLTTLDLSGNRIAQLKPDAFLRVPNLIQLCLADNMLSNLPLTIFNNLRHLRLLDLQGNRLKLVGLYSSSSNLALTLPDLRHLKLSRNPLIDSSSNINTTNLPSHDDVNNNWWLTSSCPSQLTTLYLENIDASPSISSTLVGLRLPPIAWHDCSSLVELRLTQLHPSTCLTQSWLGVESDTIRIPARFRIYPPTLDLCSPAPRSPRIEKDLAQSDAEPRPKLPNPGPTQTPKLGKNQRLDSANFLAVHNKLQPTPISSLSSAYWPTVTDHSARVVHVRSTSFLSSWLILSLIVLLLLAILVMIAFAIFYCIRHHHHHPNLGDHRHGLKKSCSTYRTHHQLGSTLPRSDYSNPLGVGSRKSDYLPVQPHIHSHLSSIEPLHLNYPPYISFTPNQLSHLYDLRPNHHLSHQLVATQPVSPADSGLEDLTPLTYPQSLHTIPRLSPSSTQTSIRRARKSRQTKRHRNPNRTHCPSTSFTSLVSGRLMLPRHSAEPLEHNAHWFSSLGLEPQPMVGDLSNSMGSISLDPGTRPFASSSAAAAATAGVPIPNHLSSFEAAEVSGAAIQSDKATLVLGPGNS